MLHNLASQWLLKGERGEGISRYFVLMILESVLIILRNSTLCEKMIRAFYK